MNMFKLRTVATVVAKQSDMRQRKMYETIVAAFASNINAYTAL